MSSLVDLTVKVRNRRAVLIASSNFVGDEDGNYAEMAVELTMIEEMVADLAAHNRDMDDEELENRLMARLGKSLDTQYRAGG